MEKDITIFIFSYDDHTKVALHCVSCCCFTAAVGGAARDDVKYFLDFKQVLTSKKIDVKILKTVFDDKNIFAANILILYLISIF